MCGIFGFVGKNYPASKDDLKAMRSKLNHRGPDSFGFFSSEQDNYEVNLGHVRLAIIDITDTGAQPMKSKNGRYITVFNGEIYNYTELKSELEQIKPSIAWTGTSDTEVLLEVIEVFGIYECVKKLVGMFALAVWDNELKKLILIRDRIGEKPLYYGIQKNQFIFSSELKGFEAHSKFEQKINYSAAVGFLTRSCVPQNLSIYDNIFKVKPGTFIEIEDFDSNGKFKITETVYWSLQDKVKQLKSSYTGSYQDAVEELEGLLIRSVKSQSISDVPLGAFLSGGVDSSLVCAIYKAHVNSELHTYTIGMPAPGTDESAHAKNVAESIGAIHKSKYISAQEIIDRIDEILNHWDEPFADSSQIPTFFVSELARKEITVSLSGDGADEFAVGYLDYPIYNKYRAYKWLSIFNLNGLTAAILSVKNSSKLKRIANFAYLLKLIRTSKNLNSLHASWRNKFRNDLLPVKKQYQSLQQQFLNLPDYGFDYAGYYDALAYLPDDIMVKVDRAAMAVSLESRAPFLDHRILEFLIALPEEFKYNQNVTKRILKDILYKYVPKEIVDRPKQGFSIPLAHWLKTELKSWASEIINKIDESSGFWDKKEVLNLWEDHQRSKNDNSEKLWNIIVLERFFQVRFIK